MCKITIFTATYNRADLLQNLFESLSRQSNKSFEWIIIDDGSIDNTEDIIGNWIEISKFEFSIRYYKQKHGGKHRALNKGFALAKGEFFFIVDSDDYLTDDAIEKIDGWISDIKNEKGLAGVAGLKISDSEICGGIPVVGDEGWIDANCFERNKFRLGGDKAEVYKTDILRQHPFPEFDDEYFVTEAVCWNAISGDGYRLRWYSEPIYMCQYLESGLTKLGANGLKGHIENYMGYCYFVRQSIKLRGVANCPQLLYDFLKTAKIKRNSFKQTAKDLKINQIKLVGVIFLLPLGFFKSAIRKINVRIIDMKQNKLKSK